MSCALTKGRTDLACKDVIGGVKNVYLFKYEDLAYTQIVGTRGVNIQTFPTTDIYKFEVKGGSFDQQIQNDANGVSYLQTLSFTLWKQNLETTVELDTATKIDLRYIVEFYDGRYQMGGVYNGARLEFNAVTGGAKTDLNGYNVTITSTEEWKAPLLKDLDDFNIIPAYLLMENGGFLLLEDAEQIEQE